MRIAYLLYLGVIGLAATCDMSNNTGTKPLPQNMDYSYSCLDSAVGSQNAKEF